MPASDLERRIRWLETRMLHLGRKIEAEADKLGWAEQQLTLARQSAEKAAGGPCSITINAHVVASGGTQTAGLVGATVEVRRTSDNALMGSGPTDASGNVAITFTDPAATGGSGTYDITASKAPRWASSTLASQAVACSGTASPTLTLSAASAYLLCGECAEPIARTLHLTDANGTLTLTSSGVGPWLGCYTKPAVAGQSWNGFNCQNAQITVAVGYTLSCPTGGTGRFRLTEAWTTCVAGSTTGGPGQCIANQINNGVLGGHASAVTPTLTSAAVAPGCIPLALSFTIAGAFVNGGVTISE
jgi:hypothetical protein